MISSEPTRRLDALKPWVQFRSSVTGMYVSRWYALLHPRETQSIRRWGK